MTSLMRFYLSSYKIIRHHKIMVYGTKLYLSEKGKRLLKITNNTLISNIFIKHLLNLYTT